MVLHWPSRDLKFTVENKILEVFLAHLTWIAGLKNLHVFNLLSQITLT